MRYHDIGLEVPYDTEELADYLAQQVREADADPGNDTRLRGVIHDCAEILYLHHFQLISRNTREIANRSRELAEIFFWGPRRADDSRRFFCYRQVSTTLLVAAVSEDWEFVRRIAGWMELEREPGYEGPLPWEFQELLFLIGEHLRGRPLPHSDELRTSVANCRPRAPRQLFEMFCALEVGDADRFNKALTKSVKAYAKRPAQAPGDAYFGERLARVESLLCAIAKRDGIQVIELEPPLAARLISSETLGLSSM